MLTNTVPKCGGTTMPTPGQPPKPRVYTPEEFRRVLQAAFGPATDWEVAKIAAPHFFSSQRNISRWMNGTQPIAGPAARVTFDLASKREIPNDRS